MTEDGRSDYTIGSSTRRKLIRVSKYGFIHCNERGQSRFVSISPADILSLAFFGSSPTNTSHQTNNGTTQASIDQQNEPRRDNEAEAAAMTLASVSSPALQGVGPGPHPLPPNYDPVSPYIPCTYDAVPYTSLVTGPARLCKLFNPNNTSLAKINGQYSYPL